MNGNEEEKYVENTIENTKQSDVNKETVQETPTAILDIVTPTTLLLDKRRTRTKSIGRPPTQVFLKETVLQRGSMDNNYNETGKLITHNFSERELNSVTQLIDAMKPQPKICSTAATNIAINTYSSSWQNITLKKTTAAIKHSRAQDGTPPWLKEVRERKTHKLSLKGDEFLNKPERERHTVVEINVSGIKTKVKENCDNDDIDTIGMVKTAENKTAQPKQNNLLPAATTYKTNSPQTSRRHTVNVDFEHLLENIETADIQSGNKSKYVDNTKSKDLEGVIEKVKDFIDQSKNFQTKMQKDFRSLELSMDGEFEKHIEELQEIKNLLAAADKK